MIYDKFRSSCLDLSAVGLDTGSSVCKNGFMPANTRVLAWLTDSPIHFCQVPELGDTVWAVNPQSTPAERIHPVAKDIPEFIGLLVRCKDAALIAGAYQWSSFRFNELLESVTAGMKTKSVLRALENTYHPPVIGDPGSRMAQLRKELVCSVFAAAQDDWRIGFNTDFTKVDSSETPGKELALNRSLPQQEGTLHVPSVYLCDNGIVVDTAWEVSINRLQDFRDFWSCRSDETLSLADKYQRQLDDPLTAAVTGILTVNDKSLRCKKCFTASWNPLDDNSALVRRILNHYRLDPDCGYLFRRYCFPRKAKSPQIRIMQLNLEAIPMMVPDQIFTVQKSGMRFRFTNPITGMEHTFTAVSLHDEALNPNFLSNHPCFYKRLTYSLEPAISTENFRIVDRMPSDYWEDYQDEPASVIYANQKPDPGRYSLSSLHYEPQDQVHWQMVFRQKYHRDMHLHLLP